MIQLALPKWKTFTQQYGHDFDPLGVRRRCEAHDPDETVHARPAAWTPAPPTSSPSPNAPYAPPKRPAVSGDIYALINRFHAAFDAEDWEKAAAMLRDIRESGLKIPGVFDIAGYEQDLMALCHHEERDQDYRLIRRMLQAHTPNYKRIYAAIEMFWSRYPGYDPDRIADNTELFAHAWYETGQACAPDDHEARIQAYSEAIRLKPDFVEAYRRRGNTCYAMQAYERACADYTQILAWQPLDAEAYYDRAYAYAARNLRQQAREDFQAVLEINPQHRHADGIPRLLEMLSRKRVKREG